MNNYTDPSELKQLRVELRDTREAFLNQSARLLVEKQRADAADRKLNEAVDLLREADHWIRVLRTQFGYDQTKEIASQIDVFISSNKASEDE